MAVTSSATIDKILKAYYGGLIKKEFEKEDGLYAQLSTPIQTRMILFYPTRHDIPKQED